MSTTKHEQRDARENPLPDDRDSNPGIGQSKGAFRTGDDPADIAGENTMEGDVQNDSTPGGGIDPKQMGRTNE